MQNRGTSTSAPAAYADGPELNVVLRPLLVCEVVAGTHDADRLSAVIARQRQEVEAEVTLVDRPAVFHQMLNCGRIGTVGLSDHEAGGKAAQRLGGAGSVSHGQQPIANGLWRLREASAKCMSMASTKPAIRPCRTRTSLDRVPTIRGRGRTSRAPKAMPTGRIAPPTHRGH
jgi:hypothetical protein